MKKKVKWELFIPKCSVCNSTGVKQESMLRHNIDGSVDIRFFEICDKCESIFSLDDHITKEEMGDDDN